MHSPKGKSCRCCCFRCCLALRCMRFGGSGTLVFDLIDKFSHVLFGIVGIIMNVAPIGAFGAMAFTIGKYGVASLLPLAKLMARVLRDLSVVHLRRAGHHRPRARLQHLEVHQLHQGRAAHRARHFVLRIGAAAHDGQNGEPRLSRNRSSVLSSRPAIRSTSTAPRSI